MKDGIQNYQPPVAIVNETPSESSSQVIDDLLVDTSDDVSKK